jgi:hypothetical protein
VGRRKRKRAQGHYCWVCERQRPNEKFSGKGHKKHVCRDCARLGTKELVFRQQIRNLERCFTFEGLVRRDQRATFERFLRHDDPRVRAEAEKLAAIDAEERALRRRMAEMDAEEEEEAYLASMTRLDEDLVPDDLDLDELERGSWSDDGESDDELPF